MSQKDWIEVGASLLGGIGIGASLMYFFDPELGEERREQCFETTGEYLSSAGERLGETWETVANKARDLAEGVADTAGDWTSRAGKAARRYVSGARSAASDYADDAGDAARSWGRRAARTARGYRRGAGDWLGGGGSRQTTGSIAGITAGVVGALALGAGLMFLLDPTQGRRRRALIRDKAASYTSQATQYAQSTGRHLSNKAQGWAHRAGEAASQVKEQAQNLASKAKDTISGNRGGSSIGGSASSGFASTSGQSSRPDPAAVTAPNCPPGII
jgi:gas vesicle protein